MGCCHSTPKEASPEFGPRPYNPCAAPLPRQQAHFNHYNAQHSHHNPQYARNQYQNHNADDKYPDPYDEKEKTPLSPDDRPDHRLTPVDEIGAGIKAKDEGVDDPEDLRRKREAEAKRRKAEQEEQERLDFFQMM
jgi:hypothetical protein